MRRTTLFLLLMVCACGGPPDTGGVDESAVPPAANGRQDDTTQTQIMSSSCDAVPAVSDRTICPKRVGPMTAGIARATIEQWFPDARDTVIDVGEGEQGSVTLLNEGRSDSIAVQWSDSTRSRISGFSNLGAAWKTQQGIGVGSTLNDLVQALGDSFAVLGYGWDYGGTVILDGTALEGSGIFFRTMPSVADGTQRASASGIIGDKPFKPTDAKLKSLEPVVRNIDIVWQR